MDWTQFTIFFLGNSVFTLTLWLWNRSEANSDRREAASDRREIHEILRELKDEMKDFHYRLLEIERARK